MEGSAAQYRDVSGSASRADPSLPDRWMQDQQNASWIGPSLLTGAALWTLLIFCLF